MTSVGSTPVDQLTAAQAVAALQLNALSNPMLALANPLAALANPFAAPLAAPLAALFNKPQGLSDTRLDELCIKLKKLLVEACDDPSRRQSGPQRGGAPDKPTKSPPPRKPPARACNGDAAVDDGRDGCDGDADCSDVASSMSACGASSDGYHLSGFVDDQPTDGLREGAAGDVDADSRPSARPAVVQAECPSHLHAARHRVARLVRTHPFAILYEGPGDAFKGHLRHRRQGGRRQRNSTHAAAGLLAVLPSAGLLMSPIGALGVGACGRQGDRGSCQEGPRSSTQSEPQPNTSQPSFSGPSLCSLAQDQPPSPASRCQILLGREPCGEWAELVNPSSDDESTCSSSGRGRARSCYGRDTPSLAALARIESLAGGSCGWKDGPVRIKVMIIFTRWHLCGWRSTVMERRLPLTAAPPSSPPRLLRPRRALPLGTHARAAGPTIDDEHSWRPW
mmetsp:Transcript_44806/g.126544  ORF Transcript_44806/g.126544 Transcript_44806/m.126544 type:complete len:451 (-) Transcript_44806:365-1717(-)